MHAAERVLSHLGIILLLVGIHALGNAGDVHCLTGAGCVSEQVVHLTAVDEALVAPGASFVQDVNHLLFISHARVGRRNQRLETHGGVFVVFKLGETASVAVDCIFKTGDDHALVTLKEHVVIVVRGCHA